MLEGEYDFDYRSVPQVRGNSEIRHARARILGGCTSHNTMISFKPFARDLDEWVAPAPRAGTPTRFCPSSTGSRRGCSPCSPIIATRTSRTSSRRPTARSASRSSTTSTPRRSSTEPASSRSATTPRPASARARPSATCTRSWTPERTSRCCSRRAHLRIVFDDEGRASAVEVRRADGTRETVSARPRDRALGRRDRDAAPAAALGRRPGRRATGSSGSTSSATPRASAAT